MKQPFHILRNFHRLPPTKFHGFNQRVYKALYDNDKIPKSTWGSNPNLLSSYFETSEKHDKAFHAANYRSVLDIAERDLLQEQLVKFLDEIAADLEAEAVRTPEILIYSGFDLGKERRGGPRKKVTTTAAQEGSGDHQGSST